MQTLKYGDSGSLVERLQKDLLAYYSVIGVEPPFKTVTGNFKDQTLKAVQAILYKDTVTEDDIASLEEQLKYLAPTHVSPVEATLGDPGDINNWINQPISQTAEQTLINIKNSLGMDSNSNDSSNNATSKDKAAKTIVLVVVALVIVIVLTAVLMKVFKKKAKL
jgi:hypothetical protein